MWSSLSRAAGAAASAAALVVLASCNPLVDPLPAGMAGGAVVQHVPYTGSFTYTVDPGAAPRDVYFVFTNPDVTSDIAQNPTVNGACVSVDGVLIPSPAPQPLPAANSAPATPADMMAESNRDPFGPLGVPRSAFLAANAVPAPAAPSQDTVGAGGPMNDINAAGSSVSVPSTCRYVSPAPVSIADGGTRTLTIWVANDCWSATGTVGTGIGEKRHLVTQAMVDALAAQFLSPGLSNDIYDWDTSVLGAEWGPHSYTNLIQPNGEITILLSDIQADNSDSGGIVGYFWAVNNFKTTSYPSSNQRIMFVVDSVMYANPNADGSSGVGGTGWAAANYWSKVVFSTLAHELQHMIQFHQKQIVAGAAGSSDTWINEMCSMIMEDLVADKLGVEGPRGVSSLTTPDGSAGAAGNTLGRMPGFNQYSSYALAVTYPATFGLTQYAVSYAFGAWLARNYGGAGLLRRIVQSPQTDSAAVTSAAAAASGKKETMERLLEKWAASVLLSDTTTAPAGYRYNTGGWTTSSDGGNTYNLGSIDVSRYSPGLTVFSSAGSVPGTPVQHASNVYFKATSALAAPRTWSLTLPAGIRMSVVLK
jgi:hypothetical protein